MVDALTPPKLYGEVVKSQKGLGDSVIKGADGRMTEEEVAECYAELEEADG